MADGERLRRKDSQNMAVEWLAVRREEDRRAEEKGCWMPCVSHGWTVLCSLRQEPWLRRSRWAEEEDEFHLDTPSPSQVLSPCKELGVQRNTICYSTSWG